MFENLKRAMLTESSMTIGDVIIAESGNGEFEAEDLIMGACVKEEPDCDEYDDIDETCDSKKKLKEEQEIKDLIESVLVDDEDDAANDYLDSISSSEDDTEISKLVDSIPVENKPGGVSTGVDSELEKESAGVEDPTIEELADELDEEIL